MENWVLWQDDGPSNSNNINKKKKRKIFSRKIDKNLFDKCFECVVPWDGKSEYILRYISREKSGYNY